MGNIRLLFYRIYLVIQRIIAPGLKYSQYIYEDILGNYINDSTNWLDLGCGHQVLPGWRFEKERVLVSRAKLSCGVDYDLRSLQRHGTIHNKVRADITSLPFRNNTFDFVTANMVVEHLSDPIKQFQEISRVLKPEGIFLFHTPNLFGYTTILARLIPDTFKARLAAFLEGRKAEDMFPTYYRANSLGKIKRIAEQIRFRMLYCKRIVSSAQLIMIPPFVILELFWIRLLMTKSLKALRTNIITVLIKKD